MRTSRYLLLPLLTGCALMAALLFINAQPTHAHRIRASQATVVSSDNMTLTLTITNATPLLNQALQITVILTNRAISETVKNPLYTLRLDSQGEASVLVPEHPQTQHEATLTPGMTDTALFMLYPLSGGEISLTAQVTVTAPLSPAGQTEVYTQTDPRPLVIPAPSQTASIIYETAYRMGCMDESARYFQTFIDNGWVAYDCSVAVGHLSGTDLFHAQSPTAAMDTFNAIRGDQELTPFHGHAGYSWRVQTTPLSSSGHGWTAGKWVNISHATDDTPYGGAVRASERIYQTMKERDLFEPCAGRYLPMISR